MWSSPLLAVVAREVRTCLGRILGTGSQEVSRVLFPSVPHLSGLGAGDGWLVCLRLPAQLFSKPAQPLSQFGGRAELGCYSCFVLTPLWSTDHQSEEQVRTC